MLLALTEEQRLIESSALSFLQKATGAGKPIDPAVLWQGYATLGWLALPLPLVHGGLGMGAIESGLLMRVFGRHLTPVPYHSNILLAARLLALAGNARQCHQWLPRVMKGDVRLAFAHQETANLDPWFVPRVSAKPGSGKWLLQGKKTLCAGAGGADAFLVTAVHMTAGEPETALFLVPVDTPGVHVHACPVLGEADAADIVFDQVSVPGNWRVGDSRDTEAILRQVLAEGLVALCWEAAGAMSAAFEQTVRYTRQRIQFGQPLASFQVIGHRLAEMAVSCEEANAACELAALRCATFGTVAMDIAAMAKSKVSRCAKYVAQEAVQLHGAMGVSDELPVSRYFRKLVAFQQGWGTNARHAEQRGRKMFSDQDWWTSQTVGA